MDTVEKNMYRILFEIVSTIIEMTAYEKALCVKYFEPVSLKKNTIVEDENKIPQYQYFVASGVMRNFHYNSCGEAVTTDINHTPRFFTSYNNFVNRCVSDEIIQCVADCNLLRLKRDNLDILYAESQILKDFTIRYLEKVFEEERIRISELATLTAEQRYVNLLTKAPNLILEVPLQHIASY